MKTKKTLSIKKENQKKILTVIFTLGTVFLNAQAKKLDVQGLTDFVKDSGDGIQTLLSWLAWLSAIIAMVCAGILFMFEKNKGMDKLKNVIYGLAVICLSSVIIKIFLPNAGA